MPTVVFITMWPVLRTAAALQRYAAALPRKDTSIFAMSLEEMLRDFQQTIIIEGTQKNIDARAIAGAISWEYEENKKGLWTDRIQYSLVQNFGVMPGNGIGWGSAHNEVARERWPNASLAELARLRVEAESAINLVAWEMERQAIRYRVLSSGVWINDCPSLLALFYHAGSGLVSRSGARVSAALKAGETVIRLNIAEDEMASWVHANLNRFQAYRTRPRPAQSGKVIRVDPSTLILAKSS